MRNTIRQFLFFLAFWLVSSSAQAIDPVLNFSDLISGPDTGLGDGLGSGVIVTIWGQHLGSSQSGSSITFTDSGGNTHSPAYVYYWKNADGALPGGPADLHESHGMQEIAFSIPDAAQGAGTIKVTVAGAASNTLPFTVRTGDIYHVKPSGSDSNPGTYNLPYLTLRHAFGKEGPLKLGDTVYLHNISEGVAGTTKIVLNPRGRNSSDTSRDADLTNQMSLITYPNTTTVLHGAQPIRAFWIMGLVFSKLTAFVADSPEDKEVAGLTATNWGRVVGNLVKGDPNYPINNGQSGAIVGSHPIERNPGIEGARIFGNQIRDYGDRYATSKLHHATYFSVREAGPDIAPIEVGWNHLLDNRARYGLHFYDKDETRGFTGTVSIHDNVVVNQGGAGIHLNYPSEFTNTFDVYNNVVINAGLASDDNAGISHTRAGMDLTNSAGIINAFNNIVYGWDADDQTSGDPGGGFEVDRPVGQITNLNDNIVYTDSDLPFLDISGDEPPVGSGNAWIYSPGGSPSEAKTPSFDSSPIEDESTVVLSINRSKIRVDTGTGIAGQSTTALERDIYGFSRLPGADLGAIEFQLAPNPPGSISLQ